MNQNEPKTYRHELTTHQNELKMYKKGLKERLTTKRIIYLFGKLRTQYETPHTESGKLH